MNNVSYSTLGFDDRDIEAALDGVAAAGFRQVELLGHEPHISAPLTGTALSSFRRRLEGRGFTAWTIHARCDATPSARQKKHGAMKSWRARLVICASLARSRHKPSSYIRSPTQSS